MKKSTAFDSEKYFLIIQIIIKIVKKKKNVGSH